MFRSKFSPQACDYIRQSKQCSIISSMFEVNVRQGHLEIAYRYMSMNFLNKMSAHFAHVGLELF